MGLFVLSARNHQHFSSIQTFIQSLAHSLIFQSSSVFLITIIRQALTTAHCPCARSSLTWSSFGQRLNTFLSNTVIAAGSLIFHPINYRNLPSIACVCVCSLADHVLLTFGNDGQLQWARFKFFLNIDSFVSNLRFHKLHPQSVDVFSI